MQNGVALCLLIRHLDVRLIFDADPAAAFVPTRVRNLPLSYMVSWMRGEQSGFSMMAAFVESNSSFHQLKVSQRRQSFFSIFTYV